MLSPSAVPDAPHMNRKLAQHNEEAERRARTTTTQASVEEHKNNYS